MEAKHANKICVNDEKKMVEGKGEEWEGKKKD